MGGELADLVGLVKNLRQEKAFVSFYKAQIRQGVQQLNASCDAIFRSLWLDHSLGQGLQRVLSHHTACAEWSHAYERAPEVLFVNASKCLQPNLVVERYSGILTCLLTQPRLVAEVLHWAESEGLDTPLLASDLASIVYGNCVFQRPHGFFLQLLRELLARHTERCSEPGELFCRVDPVLSCMLTEYCNQLTEFKTFLTESLQGPLFAVLACEDYLEYDVHKAGTRYQRHMEAQDRLHLDGKLVFGEDLEDSCAELARLASLFTESLSRHLKDIPVGIKWLLGTLKSMVMQKWAELSPERLRRPVGDVLFGLILTSAVTNPDCYGIVDPNLVIGGVARYNLYQIAAVLQGCAWIATKPHSSRYPIQKVIRRMNMVRRGCGQEIGQAL